MNKQTTTAMLIPETTPGLNSGPDWLVEKRYTARVKFNQASLPNRTQHLWRYTDPSSVTKWTPDESNNASAKLAKKLTDSNVIAIPLAEAAIKHPDLVRKHLYSLVNNQTGKFEAMNSALWSNGIFIHVPPNITLTDPIHIVHQAEADGYVFSRVLVVVGENSEVTLFDEYSGGSADLGSDSSGTNCAVEIIAGPQARVQYVNLQNHESATRSFLTHRASVAEGAQILTMPIALGGKLLKLNFGARLEGDCSRSNIYGLALGADKQHIDTHTKHHHTHGQTYSDIVFRVVARDKAESAYTGLIRIEQPAAECEAYQTNRNLMLSKGAKARTIPELEILNEEVSCSHGATIGDIDPEILFFLNARGIDRSEAIKMIVSGFVASIIDRVPAPLRETIISKINSKLESV